jgi:hypothetical protein
MGANDNEEKNAKEYCSVLVQGVEYKVLSTKIQEAQIRFL